MDRVIIRRNGQRGDRRSPYVVAEEILGRHPDVNRDTGKRLGGLIPIIESTGRKNKKRLVIEVVRGTSARGAESTRSRDRVETDATGAGVKRVCRRLRPQEAEKLTRIDAEIAAIDAELRDARDRRESIVREAFTKGHVVRLVELLRLTTATPSISAGEEGAGESTHGVDGP